MAIKIKFNFARGRHEMQLNLQKERGFLSRISKNKSRTSASEIQFNSVNLCSKCNIRMYTLIKCGRTLTLEDQ